MSLASSSTYGTINWQDSVPSPKHRTGLFKSLKRTLTRKTKNNDNSREAQPFSPGSIAELRSRFGPRESAEKLARAVLEWLQLLMRKLAPMSIRYSRAELTAAEELAIYEPLSEPLSACAVVINHDYVRPTVIDITLVSEPSSASETVLPPQSAFSDPDCLPLPRADLDCYLPPVDDFDIQEYLRSGVVPRHWGMPLPCNDSLAALGYEVCPEEPEILPRLRPDPIVLACTLDQIEFFRAEMLFSAEEEVYADGYLGADGYGNPVGVFNGGQFQQEGTLSFAANPQVLPQSIPQAATQAAPLAAPRPEFGKRFLDELRKQPEMTVYGMTQADDGRDRTQYVVSEVPQELYSEGYIVFGPAPPMPAPTPAAKPASVEGPSHLIWNQPGQTPAASFNPFAPSFNPFGAVRDAFSCGNQFGNAFDPFGASPNPFNPVFDDFGQ